jgi:hypothetical protein
MYSVPDLYSFNQYSTAEEIGTAVPVSVITFDYFVSVTSDVECQLLTGLVSTRYKIIVTAVPTHL